MLVGTNWNLGKSISIPKSICDISSVIFGIFTFGIRRIGGLRALHKNHKLQASTLLTHTEAQFKGKVADPNLVMALGFAIYESLNYAEISSFNAGLEADFSSAVKDYEKFKLESGGTVKLNHIRRKIEPQRASFIELGDMQILPTNDEASEYFPSFRELEILMILGNLKGPHIGKDSGIKVSGRLKDYYDGNQTQLLDYIVQILNWKISE